MIRLFVFGLFFSLSFHAAAQVTYYVSQNGSDSSDGLSPASAFRSLSKASALRLGPGDKILLERGSSWRGEQLVLDQAKGSAESPVLIGAYGSGERPTIYGSVPVEPVGWSSMPGSPGVFTRNFTGKTNALYDGTEFLVAKTSLSQVQSTPGTWFRSGNTVYVNGGGTSIDNLNVSVGIVDRNVWIRKSQNVIVEEIIVRDSANGVDGESFKIDSSRDMVIRQSEAHNASFHHFEVIDTDNFLGENLIATIAEPGKSGSAYVSYSGIGSVSGHDDHVWRNITYMDPNPFGAFYTHGPMMGDLLVDNMFSEPGHKMGIQTEGQNQSVVFRGGQVGVISLVGDNVVIDGMRIAGKGAIVEVSGDRNIIQNLLMEMTSFDPIKNTAVFVLGEENVVRFNTLIGNPAITAERVGFYVSPNGSADFYGNILKDFPLNVRIDGVIGEMGWNAYEGGRFSRSGGPRLSLDQWNALGFDFNSIMTTLDFLDPLVDDFRLEPGQPAYQMIPAGLLDRPLTDFRGQAIPTLTAIDPGAFQSIAIPEASSLMMGGIGMAAIAYFVVIRRRSSVLS